MPANGDGEAAAAAAAPFMLPQSEMSRLVVFRGNTKDTVTAEAWAEMVDRHISVLKWSAQQTAGAAIESMRDDANIWRENVANSASEDKRAWLKDWTLMRPEFIKRFGKAKTRAAKVQGLGQLKQATNESCGTYQDRVVHVLDKLTAKAMEGCANPDRRTGFTICRELFETAIFMNGLRTDIRLYVEMELKETSTTEEIYELARTTEIALNSKSQTHHKVHTVEATDAKLDALKQELVEVRKALGAEGATVAAVSTGAKKKTGNKDKDNKKKKTGKPMADRKPILCWRCKQWGKHFQSECTLTAEEIAVLTPMTKEDKPTGEIWDAQFPNA